MKPVVTAEAVRLAEQEWFEAHPGEDLMQVAASAVCRSVAELLLGHDADWPRVLVVAGAGNNAGDALFAAAGLSHVPGLAAVRVSVWLVAGHTHEAGLAAALAADAEVVDAATALLLARQAHAVIDGVSGLRGRPGLASDVAAVASACRDAGTPVVAVDIPSGLSADSCTVAGDSFAADETITFIAHKLAHVAKPAADRCGRVTLVDIGVTVPDADVWQVEEADLTTWYPYPGSTSDKYGRGVVGLDTGSSAYPGAAVLGAAGAIHGGAGMVRYAGEAPDAVLARYPNVVPSRDRDRPGRVQAWVCGSGWEADADARLSRRLADGVPCVLDAGALEVLPGTLPPGCVLTPHAGELARLLGVERVEVEADPVRHAREASARHGAVVLLKGATQYVASPDGQVLVAAAGLSWTATAGSGDVLAGACGALLAAGLPAARAAVLAASLQALASVEHPGPIPPQQLAEAFPAVIARWERVARSPSPRPAP